MKTQTNGFGSPMTDIWYIGTTLFAAPDEEYYLTKARQYVFDMNLNADDVKIVRKGDQILVIAKRDITW